MIVPSKGLPAEAEPMSANNNLDVIRHDGRIYMAWRTAALHFAGPEVTMMVVSTTDEKSWRFETRIALGRDVREPSFLSLGGKLFLYFEVLGDDPSKFEPQGMKMVERSAAGSWSEPEEVTPADLFPWSVKVLGGKPYMAAYLGGEHIYDGMHDPIEVHWMTTTDGRAWTAAVPGKEVVHKGGASETDFEFLDDGTLIAVLRNEAGDDDGWGSKVCRAAPAALGDWHCMTDRRKFDSPMLFKRGEKLWLVARRNVTATGEYDLQMRNLSPADQTTAYIGAYSRERKRCSLWSVDPVALQVTYVADVPGWGDTCFPRMLEQGDDVILYNYSSSLDAGAPDVAWFAGQSRPTFIYRTVLSGI